MNMKVHEHADRSERYPQTGRIPHMGQEKISMNHEYITRGFCILTEEGVLRNGCI